MAERTCTYEGCERPHEARGYCQTHYAMFMYRGRTWKELPPRPTTEQRFWAKVNKDGPVSDEAPHLGKCWLWTAALSTGGYGKFFTGGTPPVDHAHRYAYRLLIAELDPNLVIDHLCRVRACVNPHHFEQVPRGINVLRGDSPFIKAWRMDTCLRGHDLTKANIWVTRQGQRQRTCRQCDAWRHRETRRKRREARGG